MMKVVASFLLCASLTLAQGVSIPFSMNGGGMQLQGTLSGTGSGGVTCSGVASQGGEVDTFGPCAAGSSPISGISFRFIVTFEERDFVVWIFLKPNATTGLVLCGYFYETGVDGPPTQLYP